MRIDVVAQALRFGPFAREDFVGLRERLHHAGELAGEIAQHPGVLRTLSGEQSAQLAVPLA